MQIKMINNSKVVQFQLECSADDALPNQLGVGFGRKFIPQRLTLRLKLDQPGEWTADISGMALTASGTPAKKARGFMWISNRTSNTPYWILDLVNRHMPKPGAI